MEEGIRQIVCRALLEKACALVRYQGLQQARALDGEISHRRKAISDHYDKFGDLLNRLIGIRRAKLEYFSPDDNDETAGQVLQLLNQILELLRNTVVIPLQRIADHAPEDDDPESDACRELREFKDAKPWRPILDLTEDGWDMIRGSRQQAIDRLRSLPEPVIGLPDEPAVFVASTSEGLGLARAVAAHLDRHLPGTRVVVWRDCNEFTQGRSIFEAIEAIVRSHHIGLAIFSPQDHYSTRRADDSVPLGNVILEYGMFAGRYSRARAFIVQPKSGVPGLSDLKGIITAQFDPDLSPDGVVSQIGATLVAEMEARIAEAQARWKQPTPYA